MAYEVSASRSAEYRGGALFALGVTGVVAAVVALAAPAYRQLVVYGLYAIPAHLLVSFLPHEPALWVASRLYPPALLAVVGTAATLVAILVDYWIIGWLVNHDLVRPVVQESRWFQFARRWFEKAPWILIFGSALAPVPFYPVKFLAIAADYPVRRFMLALVAGRLPRFYILARVLASVDERVQPRNSTLMWIVLALAALGMWRILKERARRRRR
jgi:ribonucleoside-triphosphate reductase